MGQVRTTALHDYFSYPPPSDPPPPLLHQPPADLAFLNVPPARRVVPPPLPRVPSSAVLSSPPALRSKASRGCPASSSSSSSRNTSGRSSSNASSCSLNETWASSDDDDVWGCNGRCKVQRLSPFHPQTAFPGTRTHSSLTCFRRSAVQVVAAPAPAPPGATFSAPCTLLQAPLPRRSPSIGGSGEVR